MATNQLVRNIFAVFGTVSATIFVSKALRFLWIYARPSSLPKYIQPDSYALVTGATAGIGRGLVIALLQQGANVIIHGRDEQKLAKLKADLEAQYPNRKILTIAATAVEPRNATQTIETFLKAHDLRVTVLVNNLGGMGMIKPPVFRPFHESDPDYVNEVTQVNGIFPVLLSHKILPLLGRSPLRMDLARPSLILNITTYGALCGMPVISVYGAAKALMTTLSTSLSWELAMPAFRDQKEPVEVLCIVAGSVKTQGHHNIEVSLTVPSSEAFAKAALQRVGCGKRTVPGYFWHALQFAFVGSLPESMQAQAFGPVFQADWEEEKKSL